MRVVPLIKKMIWLCLVAIVKLGIIPKKPGLIVFGCKSGYIEDNAIVFFDYLLKKGGYLNPVWVSRDKLTMSMIKSMGGRVYKGNASLRGIWCILRAQVAILIFGFGDISYLLRYDRRIFIVFLSHGRGVKMLLDKNSNLNGTDTKDIRDNLRRYDVSCVTSELIAQQVLKISSGIEKPVVTGFPRNDLFYRDNDSCVLSEELGRFIDKKRLVLYAPTWRPYSKTRFFPFSDFDIIKVDKFLGEIDTVILLRPHPKEGIHLGVESKMLSNVFNIKLVSYFSYPSTQRLLKRTDVLITDYSSIFYDFLLLDRPIFFLLYDKDKFEEFRGFSSNYDDLICGPIIYSQHSLITELRKVALGEDRFRAKRNYVRSLVHCFSDGKSCERLEKFIIEKIKNNMRGKLCENLNSNSA